MAITSRDPLYVESSSLLTWLLTQPGSDRVQSSINAWLEGGGRLISSRLLDLEVRRVLIRERLVGSAIPADSQMLIDLIAQIPVTEEVWDRAATIEQHVRTLDAIHLATCELTGATLLTAGLDRTIHRVAAARGISAV